MKTNILCLLTLLPGLMVGGAAHANWEYAGVYTGDGVYAEDGSRFTVSVRGGASMGFGSIKNKMGGVTGQYYYDTNTGELLTAAYYALYCQTPADCPHITYAGMIEFDQLGAADDYSAFAFAAGASVGWTVPNTPQWRLEAGWDHIAESDYNASPMFVGQQAFTGGTLEGEIGNFETGGVHSTVTADIFSAMAFYDFFDGMVKPTRQAIPYVGFGLGYADVKTVLNLSDLYGDLSDIVELKQYGELVTEGNVNIIQFYQSEKNTGTVAGLIAAGISYGITDSMFLDLGARLTYVPSVKWTLTNADGDRHRDWFAADNMFWVNVMLGLRFEF